MTAARKPKPRRKRATAADVRATARLNPELSPAELVRHLGLSRQAVQAVHQALARGGAPRGRPRDDKVRVSVRLRPAVLELARAEAERDGCSLQDVLESAIAASLVPEGEWLQDEWLRPMRHPLRHP